MSKFRVIRKINVVNVHDRDKVTLVLSKTSAGWDITTNDSRFRSIAGRYGVAFDVIKAAARGCVDDGVIAMMQNAPAVDFFNPRGVTVRIVVTAQRAEKFLGGFRKDYGVARGVAKPVVEKKRGTWMKKCGFIPRTCRRTNFVSEADKAREFMEKLSEVKS